MNRFNRGLLFIDLLLSMSFFSLICVSISPSFRTLNLFYNELTNQYEQLEKATLFLDQCHRHSNLPEMISSPEFSSLDINLEALTPSINKIAITTPTQVLELLIQR